MALSAADKAALKTKIQLSTADAGTKDVLFMLIDKLATINVVANDLTAGATGVLKNTGGTDGACKNGLVTTLPT